MNRFINYYKKIFSQEYMDRTISGGIKSQLTLSVELLQSSAVDCIVRYRRPYSLLQWTVQSIIADCNNLPFKRTWLTLRNGLLFLWLVI